jgi:hypothetical protein
MSQILEQINLSDADTPARAPQPAQHVVEEPRIYGLFPAQVRGVDASGAPFHLQTLIDNFGAMEFDLRLACRVELGEQLLIIADIHEATVALHGTVLRVERLAGGSYRTAIAVTHHRFL